MTAKATPCIWWWTGRHPFLLAVPLRFFLLSLLLSAPPGCSGQEPPSLFVDFPLITARQDYCPLHREVESGLKHRRNVLRGRQLHVGIFQYQLNKETGMIDEDNPGVAERILDELSRRAGFDWRGSYGVIHSPGANETWSDVLHSSIDSYDLCGDWFLRSTERLGDGIIFPEGWYDGSLIMVRKQEEETDAFDLLAFTKPFTGGVWGLIAITIILSGVVYYLLDYLDSRRDGRQMEGHLEENIFGAAFFFAGHFSHKPTSSSTRLMAFSTCFLFLLLMAAYTANLASFLVVRNSPAIQINEISDAIRADLSFCVLRGSTSETYLQANYPNTRLVKRDTIGDTYLSVGSGECDIVLTTVDTWETNRRSAQYNGQCNLEWVGRVVQFTTAGFTLRDSEQMCSSLLRDVLDLHMIEMKMDGSFDTIWETYRERKTTNSCVGTTAGMESEGDSEGKEDKLEDARINVKNLGGMFIFHAGAMVLAMAVSLLKFRCQPKHWRTEILKEVAKAVRRRETLFSPTQATSLSAAQQQLAVVPPMNDDGASHRKGTSAPDDDGWLDDGGAATLPDDGSTNGTDRGDTTATADGGSLEDGRGGDTAAAALPNDGSTTNDEEQLLILKRITEELNLLREDVKEMKKRRCSSSSEE